jgi:hypothetical protein
MFHIYNTTVTTQTLEAVLQSSAVLHVDMGSSLCNSAFNLI